MSGVELSVTQTAQAASMLLKEAVSNTMTGAQSRAVAAEARSVAGAACKSLSLTMEHLSDGMKPTSSVKKIPFVLSQQQGAEEVQSILSQIVQLNFVCNNLGASLTAQKQTLEQCSESMKLSAALANTTWMKLMEQR